MITSSFIYVTALLVIAGSLKFLETTTRWRLFEYLPAIVSLYFVVMLCSTFGVWEKTEEITNAYKMLRNNLLPAMIFLMLLDADLRQIKQLGGRMLLAFFIAAASIGVAFVLAFTVFQSYLPADAWKTLTALSGSWMGGTGNMVAIQLALDVPDASMGYTLLIDSIDYALWVMFLLALVPHAKRFNLWVKADSQLLEKIGANIDMDKEQQQVDSGGLLILLATALLMSALAQSAALWLPTSAYFTPTAWTVLLVTVAGVICALTPLGKIAGASQLSMLMLYLIIALIASRANLAELTQAPLYIALGLMILLFHGLIMLVMAKWLKLDLFTCGVASLANIGGVASAPILAASYSKSLIPVGVLMAMIGYIVGTGGGLLVGKVLSFIASGS
ncbi:DUF819 family protein [uncultured Psychrosphaera sp.]|uniref:DUF819 family protein n=1 Tax=uncultured Psychrosphaera sp. TaxID=1403522 RepID=UPI002620AA32|nr:DUF819 family protein [uncultured Psychrosphaera sp.]